MKTKLTLSIDEELLPKAKAAARKKGRSLSELVEDALRELSAPPSKSIVDEWRGAFEPAERQDERYKYLAEKYL